MCDYPTAQLREADPEHPESVARSAGEFRVPLSREHVACPPRVRGWGSSRPVLPPRSAGVHLPPAGSLKDFLTSAVSVPGQGLLERFGRGPGPSPRPLPRDQSFPAVHILARSLTGPLQGSGSMASGECVCACVEGRVSGTEKCRFPGGQEGGGGVLGAGGSVSAQPADLGNEASSSWGGPRKAEPECGKTEGRVRRRWSLSDPREAPASWSPCHPIKSLLLDSGIFPRQAPPFQAGILRFTLSYQSWATLGLGFG